jgi:hypothetical protein
MTKLPNLLARSALVAAIGMTGLTVGAGAANAQPWGRTVERCAGDRCATYHCDYDGDRCTRVSDFRYRDAYRGYYTRRVYGYRTMTRCDSDGDRCATFRCDADGDQCTRVSGWWRR